MGHLQPQSRLQFILNGEAIIMTEFVAGHNTTAFRFTNNNPAFFPGLELTESVEGNYDTTSDVIVVSDTDDSMDHGEITPSSDEMVVDLTSTENEEDNSDYEETICLDYHIPNIENSASVIGGTLFSEEIANDAETDSLNEDTVFINDTIVNKGTQGAALNNAETVSLNEANTETQEIVPNNTGTISLIGNTVVPENTVTNNAETSSQEGHSASNTNRWSNIPLPPTYLSSDDEGSSDDSLPSHNIRRMRPTPFIPLRPFDLFVERLGVPHSNRRCANPNCFSNTHNWVRSRRICPVHGRFAIMNMNDFVHDEHNGDNQEPATINIAESSSDSTVTSSDQDEE